MIVEHTLKWEEVKEFYKTKFGIEGWVVEVFANLDILVLCASGASNKTIASFLEIDVDEIISVVISTLHFSGWGCDLPLNPYKMYCDIEEDSTEHSRYYLFCDAVESILTHYPAFETLNVDELYNICNVVSDIERKINDEWI